MPAPSDALNDRLSRYREINFSVTGRKSGRTISQPVWFAFDDNKVYLLPVRGSDTQWYQAPANNGQFINDPKTDYHKLTQQIVQEA